jgi:hypothetical protein
MNLQLKYCNRKPCDKTATHESQARLLLWAHEGYLMIGENILCIQLQGFVTVSCLGRDRQRMYAS